MARPANKGGACKLKSLMHLFEGLCKTPQYKNPVLGSNRLHSHLPVYMPAAGPAERGACVPRG